MSKKAAGGQKQGGFFSSFFGRKSKKDEPEQEETKDTESKGLIVFTKTASPNILTFLLSCGTY